MQSKKQTSAKYQKKHTSGGDETHEEEVFVEQCGLDAVHVPLAVQQRAPVQHAQGRLLVQLCTKNVAKIINKSA